MTVPEDYETALAPEKDTPMEQTALSAAKEMLLPSIVKALEKESTPVAEPQIEAVAAAVNKELAPVMVNATNNEPLWASRVFIGSIISVIAVIAGIFGVTLDPAVQGQIVDLTTKFITLGAMALSLIGSALALWGRLTTRKPLGTSTK